ncbi:hypothetical protein GGI13_002057 [Coemansia sp. RSA 455]|nr:hypothetical protein GGI13_002057 [Coemansia sp. RSA 455]
MASLSRFQTLPTLVVDMIIEYLMGHSRASSSFKQILNRRYENYYQRRLLAKLTTISAVWRSVALLLICENCEIHDSGSDDGIEVKFPAWVHDSSKLLPHTMHLVKRVLSTIRCDYIDHESIIEVHTRPGYEILSFPLATTFGLTLTNLGDYSRVRYLRIGTRISSSFDISSDALVKLAQSHFRFAPTAVKIELTALSNGRPGSGAEYLCDIITTMLCKGRATSLDVSLWRDGNHLSLELHSAQELTTITSGPDNACASFAMLAYHNSRSLTSIRVNIHHRHDWLDLIYGDTDVPAGFPRLKALSLDIFEHTYDDIWAGVKDVEMFPNLSSLEVTGAYPFVDDLLFRGNGATLQILHVPFKLIATNILGELGILDRKGVTRMRRIRFGEVTESDSEHIKENGPKVIAQQLYRILDVATSLYLRGDGPDYEMYKSIVTMSCVSSIQHLDIRDLCFRHDHVIRVIRALPNLVSFTVVVIHSNYHGDVPDHYKEAKDLHKKFYPLSSAFRTLRVPSTSEYTGYQLAKEAIRIAIVCENRVQVHVPTDELELFKKSVSEAIASEEFAPYADSLRHLI